VLCCMLRACLRRLSRACTRNRKFVSTRREADYLCTLLAYGVMHARYHHKEERRYALIVFRLESRARCRALRRSSQSSKQKSDLAPQRFHGSAYPRRTRSLRYDRALPSTSLPYPPQHQIKTLPSRLILRPYPKIPSPGLFQY
jgi:hypothetical protein